MPLIFVVPLTMASKPASDLSLTCLKMKTLCHQDNNSVTQILGRFALCITSLEKVTKFWHHLFYEARQQKVYFKYSKFRVRSVQNFLESTKKRILDYQISPAQMILVWVRFQ